MTEEQKPAEVQAAPFVPSLPQSEIYRRNVKTMSPNQLRSHLRRKRKTLPSMIDAAFAIILSAVYENTAPQHVDDDNRIMATELRKAFGTVNPLPR